MSNSINYLFESCKIMIPVVTGFIVLFGGSIGRLWESGKDVEWRWAGWTLILSIISLGLWSGTMPFSIVASLGSPQKLFFAFGPYNSATIFLFGRWCARIGHTTFFLSVISSCMFYWKIIHRNDVAAGKSKSRITSEIGRRQDNQFEI